MAISNQADSRKKKKKNKKQRSKNKKDVAKLLETIEHFERLEKNDNKIRGLKDESDETDLMEDDLENSVQNEDVLTNIATNDIEEKETSEKNDISNIHNSKRKKKKSKHKKGDVESEQVPNTDSQHTALKSATEIENGKTKKKRNCKGEKNAKVINLAADEEIAINNEGEKLSHENSDRGKKKKKRKNMEMEGTNKEAEDVFHEDETEKKKIKKKQSKEKLDQSLENISECNGLSNLENEDTKVRKKKKRKHNDEVRTNTNDTSAKEPEVILVGEVNKKKRKKERAMNGNNVEVVDFTIRNNEGSKTGTAEEDCGTVSKQKNKQKKSKKNPVVENALVEDESVTCNTSPEKTQKKKKKVMDDCDNEAVDIKNKNKSNLNTKESKQKKKSKEKDDMKDNDQSTGKRKGKSFEDNEKKTDSIVERNMNNHVFENEERQKKFARLLGGKEKKAESEVKPTNIGDKELGEKKDASETPSALSAGQWAGKMFESTERQNKFIRLLGGAKSNDNKKKLFSSNSPSTKKGLFGSLTAKVGEGKGEGISNKAMNLQSAATLNHNLEAEFNRAMNRRVGGMGSSGIGFVKDPAEGKKFHIDRNTTKSIQFNDDD